MDSKRPISKDGSNWANIVGAIAAIAAVWGFDFTPEQQASIVTGIVTAQAVINGVLRKYTG